jgi:hypothetical protein
MAEYNITPQEKALIKKAFEKTPSLFQCFSTVRSRRFGKGYSYEHGQEETHPVTCRKLFMEKGPLGYISKEEPEPLTELEEALLAWAGCGPNGVIAMDLPVGADMSTWLCTSGRTLPGPCNDSQAHLFIVNDKGTFFWKPTREREKVVEIEGEDDYYKILKWYREGLKKISDKRPDLDWSLSPGRPMGIWQWNVNKPGSTWFIPVYEIALEEINVLFSAFEYFKWYFIDDDTGEPAGGDFYRKCIKEEKMVVPVPLSLYEEVCLHIGDYPAGMLVSNIRLAAEALGLGAWIFCGFLEDLILGAFPDYSKGLGFTYYKVNGRNHIVGLPGVFEGYGLPSPWWNSVEELVKTVYNYRYSKDRTFFAKGTGSGSCDIELIFQDHILEAIRNHPKVHIPDWCVEAAIDHVKYVYEKYGRYPRYYSPMHCNFTAQIHHIDTDYYGTINKPGYMTDRIKQHHENWHKLA